MNNDEYPLSLSFPELLLLLTALKEYRLTEENPRGDVHAVIDKLVGAFRNKTAEFLYDREEKR